MTSLITVTDSEDDVTKITVVGDFNADEIVSQHGFDPAAVNISVSDESGYID